MTDNWRPSPDEIGVLNALDFWEKTTPAYYFIDGSGDPKLKLFPWLPDDIVLDPDQSGPRQPAKLIAGPRIFSPFPDFIIRATADALPTIPINAEKGIRVLEEQDCIRRVGPDPSEDDPWWARLITCWKMPAPDNRLIRVKTRPFDHDYLGVFLRVSADNMDIVKDNFAVEWVKVDGEISLCVQSLELNDKGRSWLQKVRGETSTGPESGDAAKTDPPANPLGQKKKEPCDNAFKAYTACRLANKTQESIAEELDTNQGQVSRWIKQVTKWLGSGGEMPEKYRGIAGGRIITMDPALLDAGQRQESGTKAQIHGQKLRDEDD